MKYKIPDKLKPVKKISKGKLKFGKEKSNFLFCHISGRILRIPSTVMGLTFVAAGVSVPDAVTSLKVVKEGNLKEK